MTLAPHQRRELGTMVASGFAGLDLRVDLAIARRLGATVLEILPDWRVVTNASEMGKVVRDAGFRVHSVHGCWGARNVTGARIDLASTDPGTQNSSRDELRRCLDWLESAKGTCLIVHPGGLSAPEEQAARRDALGAGLLSLADHAARSQRVVCVENMPRGVYPGSKTADLAHLLADLDRPELALAIDTGHAHLVASAEEETFAAGPRLRTTHVHDNLGRQDSHLPPGTGTIDWRAWARALDRIEYRGPIMLECIRHLRDEPESLSEALMRLLEEIRIIHTVD